MGAAPPSPMLAVAALATVPFLSTRMVAPWRTPFARVGNGDRP